MNRKLVIIMFWFFIQSTSMWAEDNKQVVTGKELDSVKVEVIGKLIRQDFYYCVEANNPWPFSDKFLIELSRTEDKNRELDQLLKSYEGKIVAVKGALRFLPNKMDARPELAVYVYHTDQISLKTKE